MQFLKKTVLTLFALSLCTGLALFLDIRQSAAAPQEGGARVMISLPLDEQNCLSLTKFLEFASEVLDVSILYEEGETEDHIYKFSSPVQVPKDKFQGYFERLLLSKCFIYVEAGEGPSALHVVVRMYPNQRPVPLLSMQNSTVVDLQAIDDYADRGCLVTVAYPLKYIDARQAITSLNPYFVNQQIESLRPVENANALIITATAQKVHGIVNLLERMDVEGEARFHSAQDRLFTLEQKLAPLDQRVSWLEKYIQDKSLEQRVVLIEQMIAELKKKMK